MDPDNEPDRGDGCDRWVDARAAQVRRQTAELRANCLAQSPAVKAAFARVRLSRPRSHARRDTEVAGRVCRRSVSPCGAR